MPEKEIDLGKGNVEKSDKKEITTAITGDQDQKINTPQKRVDLSSKLKDISAGDILDAILSTKQEELIPWEPCRLPSLGLYYDGAIPNGDLEVKPMGIYADKILATRRLAQSGFSIDYLFKRCVNFPNNFDPLNLITGDQIFLLYYLRGITHGNMYEFTIACPNEECARDSAHDYDLIELYKTIIWPNENTQKEPFKVVLPYLSEIYGREIWASVRLLRSRDLRHINQRQKIAKQIRGGAKPARAESEDRRIRNEMSSYSELTVDQSIEQNLNLVIVDINGDSNKNKIQQFVSRMHGRDTATIREFLRDNTPGIDTSIIINCPHCDQDVRMDLPITESFFRPAKRGGPREGVGTPDGAIVPT